MSEDREHINGYEREYYEKNKDKIRERKRNAMRRLRAERPEHYNKQSRNAKQRLREKLFDIYGHKCAVCGFDDKRALTLDHINNNGNKERKEFGERGVYQKARDNFSPDAYRILCMNCQFIERCKNNNQN